MLSWEVPIWTGLTSKFPSEGESRHLENIVADTSCCIYQGESLCFIVPLFKGIFQKHFYSLVKYQNRISPIRLLLDLAVVMLYDSML